LGTRVLSFHAGYGCRHRGRCCSSSWPIAVEATERTRLERAISAGVLSPARSTSPVFESDSASHGPALVASSHGQCVFHDDIITGGCRIHRALGHDALPLACRQFPRQSVRDPRDVSITLSHYCPTAQDLLLNCDAPVAIVNNPPAFPADAEYVGLTADPSLPPLLHPNLAMDWQSWWLFEELSVSLLCDTSNPLYRLGVAVEHARSWSVDAGPLETHLLDAFARAREAAAHDSWLLDSTISRRIDDALSAVPDEWRELATDTISSAAPAALDDSTTARFLAAHAFANWSAYQGEGLRTWFRSIETAACLLARTHDPGGTDLILRHLADSAVLIERWRTADRDPATPRP
jgi:hypothetical protein